ncbi:hypothetical protein BGX27_010934 [Mortierella sp. AM989]|nr:hypothetical protein BGX27_010934 [Mortierella sp. AM989]
MDHQIHIEQLDDDHDQFSYANKDSVEIDHATDINQHNRHSSTSTLVGGNSPLRQHHPYPFDTNRTPFAADIKTTAAKRRDKANNPSGKNRRGNWYRFFHSETGRLFCAFLYFFVVCIGMAFCNQLSDHRWVETNYTKVLLSDRGFDMIAAQADIQPANTFVMTSVLFTVLGIGLICPTWTTRAIVLRRIMWIIGTLSVFRSLTLSVTTLPTPKEECRPSLKTGFWDMFMVALQMIPGTVEACTDDIFSGHTVFMVTCAIQWRLYCKNKWATYFAYFYISIGLYFVVATRLHYTVDVVLAVFITYAAWSIYISTIDVVMEEEYFGIKSHHEKYNSFDTSLTEYEFTQEELEGTDTEGDDDVCATGNPTFLQRRKQLEHAMNRLRGPRIGYGRGEYDRVAFVPMQFNLWLKNIIRWCDGLDLRMRSSAENSPTSPSRWDELVAQYRAERASGESSRSSSRTCRKSDREQEDGTTYEYESCREMVQIYNDRSSFDGLPTHNYTNESRQQQCGRGRWRSLQLNSASSRTRGSNTREDKSEKTERNRKMHIFKVTLIILVNAILLIKVVDVIKSRAAAGPPAQWPKEMESYPGGEIYNNESNPTTTTTQNQQQPNAEQSINQGGPEASNWQSDRGHDRRRYEGGHYRGHREERDWEPVGAI